MKKITLLASIVIITLQTFAVKDVKAECPEGYQSLNFSVLYPGNGCLYDFEICFDCSIGPSGIGDIYLQNVTPHDPTQTCLISDNAGYYSWMVNQITKAMYDNCQLPPCDQSSKWTSIHFPTCWHYVPFVWYDEYHVQHIGYNWFACDPGGECIGHYKNCRQMPGGAIIVLEQYYELISQPCDDGPPPPPFTGCFNMWQCGG